MPNSSAQRPRGQTRTPRASARQGARALGLLGVAHSGATRRSVAPAAAYAAIRSRTCDSSPASRSPPDRRALALEHRPIGGQEAVHLRAAPPRTARARDASVTQTGTPATMRGAGRPALAAASRTRRDARPTVFGADHPEDLRRPRGPARSSIFSPSAATRIGHGGGLDREPAARARAPLPSSDDGLACEQRFQREQRLLHARERPRVALAEHALDHQLMRRADAEHEPAAGRRLRGERLRRERDRMASVDRHDRGAELDAAASRPPTAASAVSASGPVICESQKLAKPSAAARRASSRIASRLV